MLIHPVGSRRGRPSVVVGSASVSAASPAVAFLLVIVVIAVAVAALGGALLTRSVAGIARWPLFP